MPHNSILGISREDHSNQPEKRRTITVGIPFRPDSNGAAHKYDRSAIEALNQLGLNFTVLVKALPEGAHGESVTRSMLESDIQRDLNGIDLLYIPGSASALDLQEATSSATENPKAAKEEEQYNKTSVKLEKAVNRLKEVEDKMKNLTGKKLEVAVKELKKAREDLEKAKYKDDEYQSRNSYENRLIEIAKTRGMIILAVCAGSWRLLQSYNGSVRTLPLSDRGKHTVSDGNPWSLNHDVEIYKDSMLHACALPPKQTLESSAEKTIVNLNSTHWAVAKVDPQNPRMLTIKNPELLDEEEEFALQTSPPLLKTNSVAVTNNAKSDTPEGYETLYGALHMGLQFHPESYLPKMPGEENANPATKHFARQIFIYAAQAALAYKTKREFIEMTPGLLEPAATPKVDKSIANALYAQGYDYYHGNREKNITVNMKMAAHLFEQAAKYQHAGAQSYLGDIFEHGRSESLNIDKAVWYYKAAASQGHASAMFSLGLCYEQGKGVSQDIHKAAEHFQAAYDRGYEGWENYFKDFLERNPQARGYLQAQVDPHFSKIEATLTPKEHAQKGQEFYHGNKLARIKSNMRLAAGHLRIAAQHGDAYSQCLLGDILEHGRAIPQDMTQAIHYYELSANQGNESAMFSLGLCYEQGKGVPQDLRKAAELFKAAYDRGYEGWKGYFANFLAQHPELNADIYRNAGTPLLGQFQAYRSNKDNRAQESETYLMSMQNNPNRKTVINI